MTVTFFGHRVVSDNIEEMLKSIILEEAYVNVTSNLLKPGGYLNMVIDVPSDVNWYKKDVSSSEEYDLLTFLQSFYLIQDVFDYRNNKDIMNAVNTISVLNDKQIDNLANGMVISRIFRSNIEKMMNTIFGAKYLMDNPTPAGLLKWNTIKFVQADYVGNTKLQAKQKFISSYKVVCAEINK